MANLIISYFSSTQNQCASGPAGSETIVTSGTSAQGELNSNGAAVALLFSDTAHYVAIGTDPTASAANSFYLPASFPLWVDLGDTDEQFAAITA